MFDSLNPRTLCAVGWALATAATAQTAERVRLAANGRPTASIVVAADGSAAERGAAAELQACLRKITGAMFPIITPAGQAPGARILVGRAGGRDGLEHLGPEAFCIDTRDGNLRMRGADDDGTEFAVYTFLEEHLGVRWFWPGELGEVIPEMKDIAVGPLRVVQQPDFKWRHRGPGGAVWGATSGPTDMAGRELVLGVTPEHQREVRRWERRNKWGGWKIYGGHSLGEIFPPAKYTTSHPEYFALINGRRDVPGPNYDFKHGSQICTTNPDVIKTVAAWVCDFFDRNPDYDAVHITLNDSSGYCECERCRALDAKVAGAVALAGQETEETALLEGAAAGGGKASKASAAAARRSVTDRVFTYANQVSKLVQLRHPAKFVMAMAYMHYILPPQTVRVDPQVVPEYCLWGAYKHANPKIRREHEAIAAGWSKAGSRHVAIYEYYINGSWPGFHRLIVPYIADSIRFLKQHGYDLYETQCGDDFATNGINYYVAGKLLWNSSLDEKEILSDFYEKAFGRAGTAVRRFQERMQSSWSAATADGTDINCSSLEQTRLPDLFTPELLQRSADDLAAATKLAETDPVRRRIEFFRAGLRYTELTVNAVRAARRVDFKPDAAGSAGERASRKARVQAAIDALEQQRQFVEQHREDGVVPYFWAKYLEEARSRFLPLARLRALAPSLD